MLEASLGAVDPELTDPLLAATLRETEDAGKLQLARDYLRSVYFLNSKDAIYDEEALTELGLLEREIALHVPEYHSMSSAAQFGIANALRWRGRNAEALDWMHRATESLRGNPYHPVDTLAFLLSEQAMLLSLTGDHAVAATMAKEAYDMVDLMTSRQDLVAGVVETYAYTVWQRTGNAARAAAIYKRHVEDAAYFARLEPMHKVSLLRSYADSVSDVDLDLARDLLARAEAHLPDDFHDWRNDRSAILWSLAIAEFYHKDHASAFEHMRASNEMVKAWTDDQIANGAVSEIGADNAHSRAAWEAVIGWDYAQTLPE